MYMKTSLTTALLFATAISTHAASLHNKDSRSYDIHVKGTSIVRTSIASGTVKNNICSSFCTITVDGVGKIDATGSERVVIKDGRLSK